MPSATAPLSASILFRDQRRTLELLDAAAKEWARHHEHTEEAASQLAQMMLICLRSAEMMRDLWEWGRAEEAAGRLRSQEGAGDALREQLNDWLRLLDLVHRAAAESAAAGQAIGAADDLGKAADQLRQILAEVNQAWPAQGPDATPPLNYEELSRLADRLPPPPEWFEDDDDLF